MEIFYEIIMLYNEIKNIYVGLLKLDVQVKKDSESFLGLLELLKSKLENEKILFDKFINYYGKDYDFIYRMVNDNDNLYDADVRQRILDYIVMDETFNVTFLEELSEEENKKLDAMLRLDRLYMSCTRNLYLIYHSFLQEYINLGLFDELKETLLGFKYFNSFVEHDMESQLVSNKFNVPVVNYINLHLVRDTLRLEVGDEIIVDSFANVILTSIAEVLAITDMDYNDMDNKAKSINNQCLLRAGLAMLSESDYDELIAEINDMINTHVNSNNMISTQIVNEIVNRRIKDKERVRKISLRPLKD